MGLEKIFNPHGITPGKITAFGAALCAGGLGLIIGGEGITDVYGVALVGSGYVCDCADGEVARRYDMKTREGARFDSLTDKLKFGLNGAYIIAGEVATGGALLPLAVGSNFVVDFFSTRQRGPFWEQCYEAKRAVMDHDSCEKDVQESSSIRANNWGKIKAVIQMGVGLGYIAKEVAQNYLEEFGEGVNENITYGLSTVLLVSAVLGCIGIRKRILTGRKND